MPRSITSAYRIATHATFRSEVDLCFVTITNSGLASPIQVVWDTKDFYRIAPAIPANLYSGFPFDLELLTDDESAPT
ncbi:MAG TPA: hypothetical protein VKE42_02690, partial [Candidatus Cybelea sp.]|nr:hypothetical protein [Candidatus Cybelea sp.]